MKKIIAIALVLVIYHASFLLGTHLERLVVTAVNGLQ